MDLGLKGRVALVLASTSGLGLATARALAAEGARVAIAGRRMDVARIEAGRLDGAVALPADLSDRQSVAALPSAVRHALGPIDILVLNGPGPAPASARDVDLDAVRRGLDSLLMEHIRLTHDCLADMVPRGWGRILAIGSSGVESPLPNLAISNLGRSALAAYLKDARGGGRGRRGHRQHAVAWQNRHRANCGARPASGAKTRDRAFGCRTAIGRDDSHATLRSAGRIRRVRRLPVQRVSQLRHRQPRPMRRRSAALAVGNLALPREVRGRCRSATRHLKE